jgi:hypothetical protein
LRRNCCGAIVCWSTSTFEKSGENAPTNVTVPSSGIATSAPAMRGALVIAAPEGVTKTSRCEPALSSANSSARGFGRGTALLSDTPPAAGQ